MGEIAAMAFSSIFERRITIDISRQLATHRQDKLRTTKDTIKFYNVLLIRYKLYIRLSL